VKLRRSPGARATFALYGNAPFGDRFHIRVRWITCPIETLEQRVPRSGRVLDVGCGHGLVSLYLAMCSPSREVVGVDIDEHKIELAKEAASGLEAGSVTFAVANDGSLPPGPWDAVVVTDVLYLLDPEARARLLVQCAAAVRPGGVLLVKETDTSPRWKHRVAAAQEVLATRVLRITEGTDLDYASSADLAAQLTAAGLDVSIDRLDRGYLHPHVLVSGRRAQGMSPT
jgi:2-polyprenyl-3-methyl-5-hydroxy-6-metoxy-1,4-benzoquinol methylase